MYDVFLVLHSWMRWVVVVQAAVVVASLGASLTSARAPSSRDGVVTRIYAVLLDIQVGLGLMLYTALSPITRAAFQHPGEAMTHAAMRFWFVEHAVGMIAALAFAHLGRARVRSGPATARTTRTAAIFFGLSILTLLASIPWPALPYGRPLTRAW